VPAYTIHRLPEFVGLDHGALIEPIAVACHDVRLGGVVNGEYVVVLGGGPIGLLVALVAHNRGARVVVSEVNPFRVSLAREFGLDAVNPHEVDLMQKVMDETGAAGADVVFEVSGSAAGAEMLTKLPRTRGRIVVFAIFSQPPKIDLFRILWRELQLRGTRVYEPEDFEAAIVLAASGKLPLGRIVTAIQPLESLADAMHQLEAGGPVMKILVRCSEN
jgi:2-desacetyl-2-hydroxyethyl bacteriochlorophyllide A dehydrogenase